MVKICEIFSSLQGEVQGLGKPCLFIRTFGCNLGARCPVDCDTPYSWKTDGSEDIREYSPRELVDIIEKSRVDIIEKSRATRIVITGGEPLLFKDEIEEIVRIILEKRSDIQEIYIETNGTMEPGEYLVGNQQVYFNVSPKVEDTNFLAFPRGRTAFKFVARVVDGKCQEISNILNKFPSDREQDVYIMPEARTRDEYIKVAPQVAEFCIQNGYNFGPRLHLLLWGGKRGK